MSQHHHSRGGIVCGTFQIRHKVDRGKSRTVRRAQNSPNTFTQLHQPCNKTPKAATRGTGQHPSTSYSQITSSKSCELLDTNPTAHSTPQAQQEQTSTTTDDNSTNPAMASRSPSPPTPPPSNLTTLTANLNESTTLLTSLSTRNAILTADLARSRAQLAQHERESSLLLAEQNRRRKGWKIAVLCMLAVWLVYLAWCWWASEEFAYVRRRRGEVFGL